VLIVSDTFRYDYLGINGNEWIITPELDQFGGEAVVFDNCYLSSFPTIPHRCDMNTGRYSFPFHGWAPLAEDEIPLAERLSEAGLSTQLIHDTPHLVCEEYNFWRGFHACYWNRGQETDRWFLRMNESPRPSLPPQKARQFSAWGTRIGTQDAHRWINQEWQWEGDTFAATTSRLVCKWIEKNYRCDNFFLWLDLFDVHEPWDPPVHFVELYDPGFTCPRMMQPNYGYASDYTEEELRNLRAHYAGEVTLVSKWIGQVLRKLKDCGIYDESLVIFTSDHGMYLGEHDRTGKHVVDDARGPWPLYREVTHIPLIIKLPRCKGGERRSEIVQPPDICPTILDAAGVPAPQDLTGKSLTSLLTHGADPDWDRKYAFSSGALGDTPDCCDLPTVTDAEWSLIVRPAGLPELYNLRQDPGEQTNMADDNPEKVAELHGALVQFLQEAGASANKVDVIRNSVAQARR